MGSEPGGFLFPAVMFATVVGIGIYRARHEPPWKIALAVAGGLAFGAVLMLVLTWADLDTTRLTLVAVPVVVAGILAAVIVVIRAVRRWRSALRAKSPFDFT